MIPKRSPYAPVTPAPISMPTSYPSSIPEYSFTPTTPTASSPAPIAYPYTNCDGGAVIPIPSASDQTTSPSSTSTAIPVAHLEISTPSQGAIIAIGVICGILLIALLLIILAMIGKRYERGRLRIGIGGGGGRGHHHRKRRSEKSCTENGDDRWRSLGLGQGQMDPAFSRRPDLGVGRNLGVSPGYGVDPRTEDVGRAGQHGERGKEEVEGLCEVSATRANGTIPSRSGSERGHRSSKSSRSRRGQYRGM
jgi:hypothetical protein